MEAKTKETKPDFLELSKNLSVEVHGTLETHSFSDDAKISGMEKIWDDYVQPLSDRVRELTEENERLVSALEAVNEAFENYASRRKEKGTSTMKINTWNTLVFRIGEIRSVLSKARKQETK